MRWLAVITNLIDMSWASSGSWWWTGRPGILQSMGLQRVRHDWVTKLNWTETTACQPTLSFTISQSFHKTCPLSWWCYLAIWHLLSPFPFAFNLHQHQGLFQCIGSIGASVSASVLPVNIQGWSLRLTGLISFLSKGFLGVFSSTTVWRHQSLLPPFSLLFAMQ